jgi:carbon catabolite-derepressing protein kinase
MAQKTSEKYKVYPATKLGEYTIIGDIAEGTFGKVKSA